MFRTTDRQISSAEYKAWIALLMNVSRSCPNCTKPFVCIPFSSVCYYVGMWHPAERLLCVGQGRLLDRLAFVLWVCAPDHVPELQRWLVLAVMALGLYGWVLKVLCCVQQLFACKVILAVCKQKVFVYTVTLSTCKRTLCVCKEIFVGWVLIL